MRKRSSFLWEWILVSLNPPEIVLLLTMFHLVHLSVTGSSCTIYRVKETCCHYVPCSCSSFTQRWWWMVHSAAQHVLIQIIRLYYSQRNCLFYIVSPHWPMLTARPWLIAWLCERHVVCYLSKWSTLQTNFFVCLLSYLCTKYAFWRSNVICKIWPGPRQKHGM